MSSVGAFEVQVPLAGGRAYTVRVGKSLLQSDWVAAAGVARGAYCAVITDSNVGRLYGATVVSTLERAGHPVTLLTVAAGEQSKTISEAGRLCDGMVAARLDRSSFVVALGGGVIGDLAGFVASIYYRGIPFIQLPTTILAQVDSSVGGKTGVNSCGGKNLIGAFHQPIAVFADTSTLETLPEREFDEGMAEVVKHAIIRDRGLFEMLKTFQRQTLESMIARNVEIKAAVVAADEQERTGKRALLNFGHTVGHAIEAVAGYGRFLHGEAISIGMAVAARLSVEKAGLSHKDHDAIVAMLQQFHLPVELPPDLSTEALMDAVSADKKFHGGQISYVLTPAIGEAFLSQDVTAAEIAGAIEAIRAPAAV